MFPVYVSLRVTQTIAFCQVMLLVNTSAPMSELGAVNGLGQTLAAAMRALGPLGGGASWSGALSLARDSGAAAETCPGVYAYLPYGARAFLVSRTALKHAQVYDELNHPADGGNRS